MNNEAQKAYLRKEAEGQKWRVFGTIVFLVVGLINLRTKYLQPILGEADYVITGFYFGVGLMCLALYLTTRKMLAVFAMEEFKG
ncbi:MAG: hypothetical protein HY597_02390 [Candidatus Omnitrophica bacterium]|nr:hypothetical protein [Candidatus Omnitrophota bacterium]